MSTVEWRAVRQPNGAVDTDLYDTTVIDSINRFARSATLLLDDASGSKKDDYQRGQRVELEYSTDGGSTWTRRWAGFVQNRIDQSLGGRFKAECVGYDFFLRRERVNKTYSSTSISSIIQDLIQNFAAVNHNASKVSVTNDKTITITFEGERVDGALEYLASASGDERFGVDNDFDFFFKQQDQSSAPSDIGDTEWTDYDLPEQGEKSLNRVKVYYGSSGSESFVTVEDREAQKDLKDKLGATSNAVISEEFTYPNIANEEAAKEKATEILNDRSTVLSGSVTTWGRFEYDPNEVFTLTIDEKGIDTDFAIAEITYQWLRDETTITITEQKGDVADRLHKLASDVRRVSMRDADTSASGTRFLQFTSGVTTTLTARVLEKSTSGFTPGQSELGQGSGDQLGGRVDSTGTASIESKKATAAFLNLVRDLWQDGNSAFTDLTHLAIGSDDSAATRTDSSLQSESGRVEVSKFGATSTAEEFEVVARIPAGGRLADATHKEFSLVDAASGGTHYHRITFSDTSTDASTHLKIRLRVSFDVDSSLQGVVTARGQERLRDLVIGESGHEPTSMVYGTGTTDTSESDTALGSKVHEDTINSTADRSTGITDVVERIGTGEVNGNDLSELGEENSSSELLTRLVFEALSKTNSFALESNHRFQASNP